MESPDTTPTPAPGRMANDSPTEDAWPAPPESPQSPTPAPVRRSQRARRPAARLLVGGDDHEGDDGGVESTSQRRAIRRRRGSEEAADEPMPAEGDEALPQPTRRNPKRKAASMDAREASARDLPDNVLEEALAPMRDSENERAEWEGWCEVESEPAFFNVILRDLGVKDVKVQELYALDDESLGFLPKPVHGLVFLFQYTESTSEKDRSDCPPHVWFANQTTDNACATLALLNIVMNRECIDIGEKLREFRASTMDLSPPLRGHVLSSNPFIRAIHNSFTRRIDLLNADLKLQNDFDEAKSARKSKKKAYSRPRKKKSKVADSAFHFIAYVPVRDEVWELDGLEYRPLCLGKYTDDWTTVARPIIEGRMLQYEEDQISFNLLALCRSPLCALSDELGRNIKMMRHLAQLARSDPRFKNAIPPEEEWLDEESLEAFRLSKSELDSLVIPEDFLERISKPSFGIVELVDLYQSLLTEQRRIKAEYRDEKLNMDDDERRVMSRKMDYSPAIHEWIKRLCEHGVLRQLVEETK